jgi:dimethylhistidine N-methyltransferase
MSQTTLSDDATMSRSAFLDDVLEGLSQPQKTLKPKYFYDEAGSDLFEAICRTPEYYPTRTETALLAKVAPALAPRIAPGCVLVEFGSGASDKTRLLLDALPQITTYMPIDISAGALAPAVDRITAAYPTLRVSPVEADFTQPIARLDLGSYPAVLGFFPGSTIGNFTSTEAAAFLRSARAMLGLHALFLIGADLVKDPAVLIAAYDDSAGVTATFNLNILRRINAELRGDFVLEQFAHRAIWNADLARMEMHLESLRDQAVTIGGRVFNFREGETIHTENSHKFTIEGFAALADMTGWSVVENWEADRYAFAAILLERQ